MMEMPLCLDLHRRDLFVDVWYVPWWWVKLF